MKTIVSAPGKIHLMGEHAVVHGAPALLSAINRRLVVTIEPSKKGMHINAPAKKLIKEAVRVVKKEFGIKHTPDMIITVSSSIPRGMHLGSSAAVSVATVGALLYHLKRIWNPTLINKLAYEVEKKQHGTPSGGDNSICTFGGFVWFRKELEFLKTIWQIPMTMPKSFARLYLIDTGRPKEHTGDMVSHVHQWVKKNPQKAEQVFVANEEMTKEVATAIKHDDEKAFVSALRQGEKTLEKMGVVSKKVQPVIRSIERSGGAAKILGGGGRSGGVGYLLAYHSKREKLVAIAKKYNFSIETVILGEEGIRLESGRRQQ